MSQDSAGRNYQIVIPFNTALTLVVHPSFYRVTNTSATPLANGTSTKVPIFAAAGQQAPPIRFTITGAGH